MPNMNVDNGKEPVKPNKCKWMVFRNAEIDGVLCLFLLIERPGDQPLAHSADWIQNFCDHSNNPPTFVLFLEYL